MDMTQACKISPRTEHIFNHISPLHFDFSLVNLADSLLDLFLDSLILLCGCVQACVALRDILPQFEQVDFSPDYLAGQEDLDEEGNHPRHGVDLLILLLAQSNRCPEEPQEEGEGKNPGEEGDVVVEVDAVDQPGSLLQHLVVEEVDRCNQAQIFDNVQRRCA